MNKKLAGTVMAGWVAVAGTGMSPAHAATALVDFETNPALAAGPNIYVALPGPQTIVTAPATFTGGVVLGFATFFPAIAFATVPNVYGTADFGNGLSNVMTITTDPGFASTEVSFALFNGETFNQSYSVQAFNGATLVASQTLNSIAPNFNSGYGLVDIIALGGISSVTITPIGAPLVWDYLIDTVAFNQSILSIINPPPLPVVQPPVPPVHGHRHGHKKGEIELVQVNFGDDVNDIRGSVVVINAPIPEPSTWALMLAGCVATGFVAARRTRRAAQTRTA